MRHLIFLLIFSLPLVSGAVALVAARGKTEFVAVGRPSAIKIAGEGSGPEGRLELKKAGEDVSVSGEIQVDLESFKTGIGLRDRHMKETYLETAKFKTAALRLADARFPADLLKSGGDWKGSAVLSLHGVEKPVDIFLSLVPEGGILKARARFKLKLSDHAIQVPKFSGITVADEVDVTAESKMSGTIEVEGT